MLAGAEAPRIVSDQVQVGAETFFGEDDGWFASLEGYFRTFDGVAAVNAVDDPNDDSDALVAGDGDAYGVDLYVKRDRGATTGWISVSFLKTLRSFPDTRVGIEPKPLITYPPVFDRRFEVDLALRRPLDWWGLEIGVRANFGTGLPFTRPLGTYHVYRSHLASGVADPDDENAVLLGPRNGARYPSRHRLDLSLRKTITKGWGTMTPYLSVINVTNKKNPLFYFYNYDASPPVREGVSMIPLLPTLGLEGLVPMMGGADCRKQATCAGHPGVRQRLHPPARHWPHPRLGHSRRARGARTCATLTAVAATAVLLGACELTEVTLAESDDVVIAETRLVLNLESGDRAASLNVYAYLHRTLSAARADEVEGAIVRLSGASGAVVHLDPTEDGNACLSYDPDEPNEDVGSCYRAVVSPSPFVPREVIELEVVLADGGVAHRIQPGPRPL